MIASIVSQSSAKPGEPASGGGVARVGGDGPAEMLARHVRVAVAGIDLSKTRVGARVTGIDAHRLLERLVRLVETIEVLQADPEHVMRLLAVRVEATDVDRPRLVIAVPPVQE